MSSVRFDSNSFTSDLPSIVGKAEAEHTSIIKFQKLRLSDYIPVMLVFVLHTLM